VRDQRLYLEDILEAIEAIERFVVNDDFKSFYLDDKTSSAVVRKFEVIGEATKKIDSKIRKKYPEIPWKEIAGFRDRLIHDYFGIDYELVWNTIDKDSPDLKAVIKVCILNENSKP